MGNYVRSSSAVSFGILLMLAGLSCGNFPVLDVDTNMRIVLVPYDTPVSLHSFPKIFISFRTVINA